MEPTFKFQSVELELHFWVEPTNVKILQFQDRFDATQLPEVNYQKISVRIQCMEAWSVQMLLYAQEELVLELQQEEVV